MKILTIPSRFRGLNLFVALSIVTLSACTDDQSANHESATINDATHDDATHAEATRVDSTPYEPTWASLAQHNEAPEWFRDAKLGIYFHWGVYSVPAFGSEWYSRNMYLPGGSVYEHHLSNYGDPREFGYHHFVPMFTAEKFDAEEWADLFQQAGAKFAGPVAQHHDGFAMWASDVNPWNARDKGPKRDITGELAAALRKRQMRLITTFHHAKNWQRTVDSPEAWDRFDVHFPYSPDYHSSSNDPALRKLYGNLPEEEFHQYWEDQLQEVIDRYQPDIIWFDSWLNFLPEQLRQKNFADYLNKAERNNQEVVIAYKQSDLSPDIGVQDIEQGGLRDISQRSWMTDLTLSNQSWSYVAGQTYKEAPLLIRNLIDVVSKNGVVLLNISPRADGSIPDEQRAVLTELGDWLGKHGEAIYETKPWDLFGFGTGGAGEGGYGGQSLTVKYTANDVRFTQSKDEKSLYLFFLGRPNAGDRIWFKLLARHRYRPHTDIKRVLLLGTQIEAEFDFGHEGLALVIPDAPMDDRATVFKFELE